MAFPIQTPQRPLPGAYFASPAGNQASAPIPRPQFGIQRDPPPASGAQSNVATVGTQPSATGTEELLSPVERASRTINDTLLQELRYPELDAYITQGISSEYDMSSGAAWSPFSKSRTYPIPDRIFDQYNQAQIETAMGLFADIKHAWISIDNAFYLWDYTHPDPPIIGFEEQHSGITAVCMIKPREGVFVKSIERLLVIATTTDIILVGVSLEKLTGGSYNVTLYQTRMVVPVRGLSVVNVAGTTDGRIFFTGTSDNDVYEVTYQQEERWFFTRCQKVNHTTTRLSAFVPNFNFSSKAPPEITAQIVADDTRKLLYTLSTQSAIRVFHMRTRNTLNLAIQKTWKDILSNIGHMTSQTELITSGTRIVSIHPISSEEAVKLHLMAVTDTGCRIFLSATQSFGYMSTDASSAPMSMQVHHVKFPPPPDMAGNSNSQITGTGSTVPATNTSSRALVTTREARRYGPGFFLSLVSKDMDPQNDELFLSAPDAGRISRPQDQVAVSRYPELAMWIKLGSRAEAVGLVTEPFYAAKTPQGFANELAVQFDKANTEFAILTNSGIHTYRRQRLVDMFVSAIRNGRNSEGLEGTVKKFIRLYGRTETAATALAVACGQAVDSSSELRGGTVTDPLVIENAKTAFIEYGGKPSFNENALVETTSAAADMVQPSPRHDGLALYISRLVRSFWKSTVIKETTTPTGGIEIASTTGTEKLQIVQQDLNSLREFLENNKNFIDGLAGPEALGRVSTRQQEVALQAEHRALHALVTLISNIIEGISFVQMLFSERIGEIVLSLNAEVRENVRKLTYESLFSTSQGKETAKELVKAIVNRNIVNGANVETVADALRRRCGSFCSPADVVIFRAQEQLRRAVEVGGGTELGRNLLNESLRLFKDAASSLSHEQLENTITQYTDMHFFAGAINLCLEVAHELDRGNRALIWIQNGRPENDAGRVVFESRKVCYNLIHRVIAALDDVTQRTIDQSDADASLAQTRRREAYAIIDTSDDEVFQTDLYDWYIEQNQADRLLLIQSPYVITYLERRFEDDLTIANLLWRYHSQAGNAIKAARVQFHLAGSAFALTLNDRIEYLGRARANASASSFGNGRQARQQLLHEIGEQLDVANIQSDILERLRDDERLQPERRTEVINQLDGPVQPINVLFNNFADQAGYHDICLLIYQAAQHQNRINIIDTWRQLIDQIHLKSVSEGRPPYEAVANQVRILGNRLNLSSNTFPVPDLLPRLKRYEFEFQRGVGPETWVADIFIELGVEFDGLFTVLVDMLFNNEAPFHGANRHYIADDVLYLAQRWFQESSRGAGELFGSETNARGVQDTLANLPQSGLSAERRTDCQQLRMRIDQFLR